MQKIQITEARRIAERIGAEAVVVLAFSGDNFAATSYGETKQKCAITAKWLDCLCDQLTTGKLAAPPL
jgi:hypothetical protein